MNVGLLRHHTPPLQPLRPTEEILEDLNVAIGRLLRIRETATYLISQVAENERGIDDNH